jgi:hypothetical protein
VDNYARPTIDVKTASIFEAVFICRSGVFLNEFFCCFDSLFSARGRLLRDRRRDTAHTLSD